MEHIIWVILVLFLASTIFATFGFGDALLAQPFLTFILGLQTATPLLALSGLTLAILLFSSGRAHIQWKEALKLIVGSLLGVPVGVWILRHSDEKVLRLIAGSLIAAIALFNLLQPNILNFKKDNPAPLFGWLGGVLGGMFNVSGPPVVIYGAFRQWSPTVFTAMMQAFFIPTDIFVIVGHWQSGLLNKEVLEIYLYCLPVLIMAVLLGTYIRKKIPIQQFRKAIFMIILISGLMLVIRTLLS